MLFRSLKSKESLKQLGSGVLLETLVFEAFELTLIKLHIAELKKGMHRAMSSLPNRISPPTLFFSVKKIVVTITKYTASNSEGPSLAFILTKRNWFKQTGLELNPS